MRLRAPFAAATLRALAVTAALAGPAVAQDALPEGPGKAAVTEACTQCHDISTVTAQRRGPDDWADVLDRMVGFGASLSETKKAEIQAYLNANLGKGDTAPETAKPAAPPAPAAAPSPSAKSR
jgi:cytochrome c2